jgi:hypothetical protein
MKDEVKVEVKINIGLSWHVTCNLLHRRDESENKRASPSDPFSAPALPSPSQFDISAVQVKCRSGP